MKCYKLKVKLLNIKKPPVWRDILVSSEITFETLHEIIQIAMGWDSYHLHQFIVGDRRRGTYIGAEVGMGFEDMLDESSIGINQCLKNVKDKFWYEYDFGDGWEHEVTLLEILEVTDEQPIPFVIKGKGACPPEDCGGAWGYEELKEVIKNPKAEEYEQMMEWLGGDFDPMYFDIEEANASLANEIMLSQIEDMIEGREPNDILINFSKRNSRSWSEAQIKAAKKEFGEIVNLEFPVITAQMAKEEIQILAATAVEQIFQLNPKAVHVVGEGSFCVILVHFLLEFGIPCIESTFEKNIGLSKTGKKEVDYNFVQFREYF